MDGIQWLVDLGDRAPSVVFARGISATELAVRMGGDPGRATQPITHAEVSGLRMQSYRPGARGDGVVRVGESAGWAFAVEYGDSTGFDRLADVSREGAEAIQYYPVSDHPPATVFYARDGEVLCGFGLGEEHRRWGQQPDLLLPDLVAAQVFPPDGSRNESAPDEPHTTVYQRTLTVIETRFGLSLPRTCLAEGRLPAYAVRGTPGMDVNRWQARDHHEIRAWADAMGFTYRKNVPPDIRAAFLANTNGQDT